MEKGMKDFEQLSGMFEAVSKEHLGCWTPVVIAAAFVARELHKGQRDKGGNDYFTSHLLAVGSQGYTWKEKTVGFLHDAAEDTPHSVDEVVDAVRTKLNAMAGSPSDEWTDEFDKNKLALRVKLNDLRSNMDLSRIPQPTDKDLQRLERYKAEYAELMECL